MYVCWPIHTWLQTEANLLMASDTLILGCQSFSVQCTSDLHYRPKGWPCRSWIVTLIKYMMLYVLPDCKPLALYKYLRTVL